MTRHNHTPKRTRRRATSVVATLALACGLTVLATGLAPAPASAAGNCRIWLTSYASEAEVSRGENIEWKASGTGNGWTPGGLVDVTTEMPPVFGHTFPADPVAQQLDASGSLTGGVHNINEYGDYVFTISAEDGCSTTLTVTVTPWPGVPHGCSWENVMARNDTTTVTAGHWTKVDVLANDDVCRQYMVVSVATADPSLQHRVNADQTISVRTSKHGKTLRLTYTFQITGTDPDFHLRTPATLTVRSKARRGGHHAPAGPKAPPATSVQSASGPQTSPAPAALARVFDADRAAAAGAVLGGYVGFIDIS